jgi:hypothetical protein
VLGDTQWSWVEGVRDREERRRWGDGAGLTAVCSQTARSVTIVGGLFFVAFLI